MDHFTYWTPKFHITQKTSKSRICKEIHFQTVMLVSMSFIFGRLPVYRIPFLFDHSRSGRPFHSLPFIQRYLHTSYWSLTIPPFSSNCPWHMFFPVADNRQILHLHPLLSGGKMSLTRPTELKKSRLSEGVKKFKVSLLVYLTLPEHGVSRPVVWNSESWVNLSDWSCFFHEIIVAWWNIIIFAQRIS